MKRVVSVLTLGVVLGASLQRPEPAAANPAAVRAAIGACVANPGVCAVLGAAAGGTYIIWKYGGDLYCTMGQCQKTRHAPAFPRENRIGGNENIPGQVETHFVMSRQKCQEMFNRYKHEGLTRFEFERQRQPGAKDAGLCKMFGSGARVDRFHDHRYDSDY